MKGKGKKGAESEKLTVLSTVPSGCGSRLALRADWVPSTLFVCADGSLRSCGTSSALFPGFVFGFALFSSLLVTAVCVMDVIGDCGGMGEDVELVETSGRTGDGGEAL